MLLLVVEAGRIEVAAVSFAVVVAMPPCSGLVCEDLGGFLWREHLELHYGSMDDVEVLVLEMEPP